VSDETRLTDFTGERNSGNRETDAKKDHVSSSGQTEREKDREQADKTGTNEAVKPSRVTYRWTPAGTCDRC